MIKPWSDQYTQTFDDNVIYDDEDGSDDDEKEDDDDVGDYDTGEVAVADGHLQPETFKEETDARRRRQRGS